MDVTLVTEGTYPHVQGGVSVWCDQMVRGLKDHRFHLVALSATGREPAVYDLPENVASFRAVPIWTARRAQTPRGRLGSAARRTDPNIVIALLTAALSSDEQAPERFETALFELFLHLESADLSRVLQSDAVAVALSELWRRFDGDRGPKLRLADAMAALDLIEHALRPLAFQPPRADVTHAVSNGLAALVGLTSKWLHGTPLIIAEHGVYLRERYLALRAERLTWPVKAITAAFTRRLCEAGYRAADLITPCNEYNQRWERRLGADPAKLQTVYNGVDPERFPVAGPEPAEPTLVFVGRIDPLKDLGTLIRAFAIVRERLPTARLRIFGTAPKGGAWYQTVCTDLVAELGLQSSVVFEGQCTAVREAYEAGHVVVLSSISEGLPFTILEAMACGRPNVGTEVGGVSEAIGDTGLIVPPRRPGELARACLTLLTDHELRHRLGRAARERALEMFTIGRAVDTFDGIYRGLVHAERPSVSAHAVARSVAQAISQSSSQLLSQTSSQPSSRSIPRPLAQSSAALSVASSFTPPATRPVTQPWLPAPQEPWLPAPTPVPASESAPNPSNTTATSASTATATATATATVATTTVSVAVSVAVSVGAGAPAPKDDREPAPASPTRPILVAAEAGTA